MFFPATSISILQPLKLAAVASNRPINNVIRKTSYTCVIRSSVLNTIQYEPGEKQVPQMLQNNINTIEITLIGKSLLNKNPNKP